MTAQDPKFSNFTGKVGSRVIISVTQVIICYSCPSHRVSLVNHYISSRPISGLVDHQGLQQDLNSLYDWSGVWGLSFNHKKCETMRISRKRISQAPSLAASPYVLGDNALSVVTSQKDLGVTVNNTLTWSLHVFLVVAKANQ